jgi:hypothetical protein
LLGPSLSLAEAALRGAKQEKTGKRQGGRSRSRFSAMATRLHHASARIEEGLLPRKHTPPSRLSSSPGPGTHLA